MAGKSNGEAASGECTLASSYDRVGSSALVGLEPKTASSGLHAPASTATGNRTDRTGIYNVLHASASVACAACPLPSGLVGASGSQRTYPNGKSGHHQALWRSRILGHLPGVSKSLTSVLKGIRISSSRTSVLLRRGLSGLSCSLPLTCSHFLPAFALHPAVFADLFFGSPSLALIQPEQALQFLVAHFVGIESIQQALKHAIWEKRSHLDLGLEQEWNCYGIPLQLFLDNAWAHHSHSLENVARVISRNRIYNAIDLVFRPPYKGRYGAIIERLFKNFSGQVKELVTGAIASSDPKELRRAANNACLLYPDMNRLLHQFILKYQHTPHRELSGLTPHQKWSEGIQSSGFPVPPPFTPAMDRLFMRMHPQTRQVRSTGIPAFGLNYWSAELGGIERVDRTGRAVAYNFRYDPVDISRIALFRNGEWIGDGYARELQQADGSYLHLSLAEWKTAKRLVGSSDHENEGKTPEEPALVTDLKALGRLRAQEKKAAQRTRPKPSEKLIKESLVQPTSHVPSSALDEETERVLRFLHG